MHLPYPPLPLAGPGRCSVPLLPPADPLLLLLLQALAAAVSLCFPQLHSLNVGSVSLLCRRADSSNLLRAGLAWDPKVKAYRGDRFARQVGFRIPDRGADLPSFYFGFGMALSLSWFLCPHPALTFA